MPEYRNIFIVVEHSSENIARISDVFADAAYLDSRDEGIFLNMVPGNADTIKKKVEAAFGRQVTNKGTEELPIYHFLIH